MEPTSAPEPALRVEGLTSGWGKEAVVFDVALHVGVGRISCLLGHNGAGKTTTARTVAGALRAQAGRIEFDGSDLSAVRGPRPGMAYVPSERFSFPELTVEENLNLGGVRNPHGREDVAAAIDEAYDWFPILAERRRQLAGTMSGGQQRMLSIGMAMVSRPRLMLLDEPSLGLSPKLADEVFEKIQALAEKRRMSVLLLEQNIGRALSVSTDAFVMRSGGIVEAVAAADLLERGQDAWWELV